MKSKNTVQSKKENVTKVNSTFKSWTCSTPVF